mmetsp:Transcript_9136/g.19791  ORF Transcript_9136/g.19791 Transcript_9136/m.19791 type:complete len:201 (-) Transcript_9136:279-881(-)
MMNDLFEEDLIVTTKLTVNSVGPPTAILVGRRRGLQKIFCGCLDKGQEIEIITNVFKIITATVAVAVIIGLRGFVCDFGTQKRIDHHDFRESTVITPPPSYLLCQQGAREISRPPTNVENAAAISTANLVVFVFFCCQRKMQLIISQCCQMFHVATRFGKVSIFVGIGLGMGLIVGRGYSAASRKHCHCPSCLSPQLMCQ